MIDLTPWIILWAAVMSAVLLLLAWRLVVVHKEHADLGWLHVAASDPAIEKEESQIAKTLVRIDFWGKTLTVLAGLLVLAIGVAWLYNGWLQSNEVIH